MHYEGEYVEIIARAQQKGRRRITRDARTDWVDYESVQFGFTKLTPAGGKQQFTAFPFVSLSNVVQYKAVYDSI